jgi:hypothetical protein
LPHPPASKARCGSGGIRVISPGGPPPLQRGVIPRQLLAKKFRCADPQDASGYLAFIPVTNLDRPIDHLGFAIEGKKQVP